MLSRLQRMIPRDLDVLRRFVSLEARPAWGCSLPQTTLAICNCEQTLGVFFPDTAPETLCIAWLVVEMIFFETNSTTSFERPTDTNNPQTCLGRGRQRGK
eukprot:3939631-Amphidinium_carterae.1